MARARVCLLGAALAATVSGCAASSSIVHTPPSLQPHETELSVDADADAVWSRLIQGLPAAGLTITHQDRSVGIIEASLTTQRSETYIDCGRSERTFEPALGPAETYGYEAAAGASYRLTTFEGKPLAASRDTLLDATANIFVESAPPNTNVVVDASYNLRTMVTYQEVGRFDSGPLTGRPTTITREVGFRTNQPGTGDEEISFCTSRGTLEQAVLRLAAEPGA